MSRNQCHFSFSLDGWLFDVEIKGVKSFFSIFYHSFLPFCENLGGSQVRNKVDVNRPSSMGVTPLHLTALNNHPHLARYLGYARADKNLYAKKPGSTPLMMAVPW